MNAPHDRWFLKADHDLANARIVLDAKTVSSRPLDTVCFHCHQAVEKYLKGYLAFKGMEFRKEHDLEYLLDLCMQADGSFAKIENVAEAMNGYGVAARYPTDFVVDYTDAEAKIALEWAERVAALVRSITGSSNKTPE